MYTLNMQSMYIKCKLKMYDAKYVSGLLSVISKTSKSNRA